ncbi:DUF7507 domain-containing protein [Cohnella soli]|uniref:DUF6923 family protein n=1 Tax=Cohnella soli TaxID=425005 RepID=A0ABW0I063_9BACL
MPATVSGVVFNDLNHNGTFDPGEPGIPNVVVVLFSSAGGTCTSAVTDANGNYSFTVTVAGTYTVYEPVADPGLTCPPTTFTQPAGFTMSNGPRKLTVPVSASQISGNVTIGNQNFSHDTNTDTLTCNSRLIQFAGRPSVRYSISVVTGGAVVLGTVNPPVDINAIGYNPLDNFIYGYDQLNNNIVRVDNSGNVTALSPLPPGFPTDAYTNGAFDSNGFFYIFTNNATKFYVIDLRPNSSTFMKLVNPATGFTEQTSNFGVNLSSALNASDWVINPLDNLLYGITPTGIMQRIVPTTGSLTSLTTTPHNTGPFGAIAVDATGTIYAISNQTGAVYRYIISGNTATASQFSTTVTTSFNDATMCPSATVQIDFGDAPDTAPGNGPDNYSSLLSKNGPRHDLVDSLFLGTQVTAEPDALQNATATGDDIRVGIQDDGLTVPLPPIPFDATSYSLDVRVTNNIGNAANLYGWVDFNGDGIFQGDEASAVQSVPSQAGIQTIVLNFTIPVGVTLQSDHTFVRLRLTSDNLINQNVSGTAEDTRSLGAASDGEVEDYIVQITSPAALNIVKTASVPSGAPGDIVTYTFEVSNPSNVTLTNVRVEDSLLGLIDILSSLAPGARVDLTASFVIPPDALAGTFIENTVVVFSDQTEPVKDIAQVKVLPSFSLVVAKTSDRVSVAPGEIVTYTIEVINTSNAPITDVKVTDALLEFSQVISSLGVGESRTFVVTFTIPTGATAGSVFTNVVTATSIETPPVSDTATVIVAPIPSVFIFKSVNPQIAAPGDTVTYTITVSNAGNQTLANVHIVDPTLEVDQTFDALEPGDSVQVTVPFVIPITALQGDTLVNVATVTSNQTGPESANADVVVFAVPDIALDKSVSPAKAPVGSTVTYTFVVTNTGNTILDNVRLTDPLLGLNQTIGTLEQGQSLVVEFPFVVPADATNPFVNKATATGMSGSQTVEANGEASLVPLFPAFTLTKTVDQTKADPGDTVNFTFTIVNTGSAPLTNIVITDPLLAFTDIVTLLEPGASLEITIPFVVPANATPGSVITNVVSVSPAETEPKQAIAEVTVNSIPALALTKTPDRVNAMPGDTITYTVIVTNTGNIGLTNVIVSDPLLGFNAVLPSLAVGQSQSFTLTFVVPAGTPDGTVITNTSTVISDQAVSDQDTANVLIDPLPPALEVVKTADRLTATPGDTITYTITVTNTGAVTLTNVALTDAILGIVQTIGTLIPGQSLTFTFLFTIPEDSLNDSNIVNTAVATSDQTDPVEGTASVTVDPSPGLSIEKSSSPSQAAPGQTVTVTFTARNTGNVRLTNVVIADPSLSFRSVIPTLPVGSAKVVTTSFIVPTVPAGTVLTNTATAFSDETGQASSTSTVTVLPEFQLSLVKTVSPSIALPEDTVTFTIKVSNTSNTTVTNVRFIDGLLGIDETVDSLAPGFFVIFTRTFTIPADARGGSIITNTATLSSAETPPITAIAQVTVADNPRLMLSKTALQPVAFPGEVVFFRVKGMNTGNVPLFNIRYADPLLGISGIVLAQDVGVVESLIIPFTVPTSAIPGETIVNTAFVDSTQTGPLGASASVRIIGLPLTVTKRTDSDFVFVGDKIRFMITIANTSTIEAINAVLTDPLQAGTQFVPGSVIAGGTHVPSANPESGIPLGNIAPGHTIQVVFQTKQIALPSNETLHNQAAVSFQPVHSIQRFTVHSNIVTINVEEHAE